MVGGLDPRCDKWGVGGGGGGANYGWGFSLAIGGGRCTQGCRRPARGPA